MSPFVKLKAHMSHINMISAFFMQKASTINSVELAFLYMKPWRHLIATGYLYFFCQTYALNPSESEAGDSFLQYEHCCN